MPTQYSPILRLALPVQGELDGTWGDTVNNEITSQVEQAIAGAAIINTWTSNSNTLTVNNGTSSTSRCAMLIANSNAGQPSAAATIIIPNTTKLYVVRNNTGQTLTVKTAAGTGVAIPTGNAAFVFCDGTNVLPCETSFTTAAIAGNASVGGTLTVTGSATIGALVAAGIDNTPIGATSRSTGAFTTLASNSTTTLGATTATSINNTPIGATTPSTGAFTTLSTTGVITSPTISTINSDIAGKANLAGGNTFTGNQTFSGLINATSISAVLNGGTKPASDLIATYPAGLSFYNANGGTGWPIGTTQGVVITYKSPEYDSQDGIGFSFQQFIVRDFATFGIRKKFTRYPSTISPNAPWTAWLEDVVLNASGNLLVGTTTDLGFGLQIQVPSTAGGVSNDSGILIRNPGFGGSRIDFRNSNGARAGITFFTQDLNVNVFDDGGLAAYRSLDGVVAEGFRLTPNGYFKVTNSGTYSDVTSAWHTIESNQNTEAIIFRNTNTGVSAVCTATLLPAAATGLHQYAVLGNTVVHRVLANGNVQNTNGVYGSISDRKLKQNITPAKPVLAKLRKVQWVNYELISNPELKQFGVIAQDLEEIYPGLIERSKDTREVTKTVTKTRTIPAVLDDEGNITEPEREEEYTEEVTEREETGEETLAVKYSILYMLTAKALQEAMDIVDKQGAMLESLEARVIALEKRA